MARTGNVRVSITGDSRDLERATTRADRALDRLNGAGRRVGQGLRTGLAAGGLAAAAGLSASAKAAVEAEKSQARLEQQLKALGISYKDHAKSIDTAIQKTSQLSGLDDEDLADSFTNIVRVTGDVNEALKLNGLAADFARAKHMDVAKAGELVGKVAGGNTGILSRYGITLKDGATATEALGVLQQKFAGQAKAYGDTTAGSLDRAKVAGENLGETVGAKLTPLLARLAEALVRVAESVQRAWPRISRVASTVFGAVASVVAKAKAAITGFVRRNREDIDSFIKALRNVAQAVRTVFVEVVIPIIRKLLPAIRSIFEGAVTVIRGAVRIISGILTGDFGKAWNGVKDIFRGALKVAAGIILAATAPIRAAVSKIAGVIKDVLGGAWRAVKSAVRDTVQFMRDRLSDVLGFFQKILEAASKVPLIGGKFRKAAEGIQKMRDELEGTNEEARKTPSLLEQITNAASKVSTTVGPQGLPGGSSRNRSTRSTSTTGAPATSATASSLGGMMSILNGGAVPAMAGARSATATSRGYSYSQLANLWIQAGGDPSKAGLAAAIALAESGGNAGAVNTSNSNGSIDRGLWQINSVHGGLSTTNPLANAKAAVQISGGGRDFNPWTVYKSGDYRKFMRGAGGRSRKRKTVSRYPLAQHGKLIGTPHAGTHTLGNWQSDNAVDIAAPVGTEVLADQNGTIVKVSGSYQGGADRYDGFQVTLRGNIGESFYTHLSKVTVRQGQRVKIGDVIGLSGAANGVGHLHYGRSQGDPREWIQGSGTRTGSAEAQQAEAKRRQRQHAARARARHGAATHRAKQQAAHREAVRRAKRKRGKAKGGGTAASTEELTGLVPMSEPVRRPGEAATAAAAAQAEATADPTTTAAEAQAALAEQIKGLREVLLADHRLRERLFASQSGQILAGIADMVSGQIGGSAGLGIQTPSFAGNGTRH